MVYFYLPVFSIVPKHIKWPFLTKRVIHELLEEVMNFSHFTTFDFDIPPEIFEPSDDWENEYEKLLQVCALCFSVFWMNVLSLSLWSSVISSLTNCNWTASLERNTEWSGQETTNRGKFYNNLVTFGLLNTIYLPTKSSQKFKSLSWTKIVKRYKWIKT